MRVWQVQQFDGRDGTEIVSTATPAQALPEFIARVGDVIRAYWTQVLWVEVSQNPSATNTNDFVVRLSNASDSVELVGRYVQGLPGDASLTTEEDAGLITSLASLHRTLRTRGFTIIEGPERVQLGAKWVLRHS